MINKFLTKFGDNTNKMEKGSTLCLWFVDEKLWKMFWLEVNNLECKDFATAENAQCAEKLD